MSETKQNLVDLLTKIQAYDGLIQSLQHTHKDDEVKVTELLKVISARKLVLIEETHKLLS